MSVNLSEHLHQQLLNHTRTAIQKQLTDYHSFFQQIQTRICGAVRWQTQVHQLKEKQLTATIHELQQQVADLKQDNTSLRKQQMTTLLQLQDAVSRQQGLLWQNEKKEQRIQQLFREVESFKRYIHELKESKGEPVNFDDEDSPIRIEELQVIKEESEHDMSMTLSLHSLHSEIVEEESTFKNVHTYSSNLKNADQNSQNISGIQNCPIDNYKDALQILKNYNNATIKHTKSSNKLPQTQQTSSYKKISCGAINKIKKLRKIQNIPVLNSCSTSDTAKSYSFNKQNDLQVCEERQALSVSPVLTPHCSETTIPSRPRSLRNTQILSLDTAVNTLNRLLQNLSAVLSHPLHTTLIKDSLSKIHYAQQIQYQGRCNQQSQPSGYGKLLRNKEIVYQGQWRQGKMHGWGKFIELPPLQSTERVIIEVDGNFRNGITDGTVMCIFNTGQRFMGTMRRGRIEQQGTFVGQKGIFTGYWQDNRLIFLI